MTELTIDSYFIKLNQLEIICNDPLTTSTILNTHMTELNDIVNNLELEIETLPFPTTTIHLRKLILVELERNNNSYIQSKLLNLISIRQKYTDEYIENTYPTEKDIDGNIITPVWDSNEKNNFALNYELQTNNIKNVVNDIISNCNCMSNRLHIINNINKLL